MAKIIRKRMMAEMDGDFVVFIIGMRINRPWKIHKWLPVFLSMPAMLKELYRNPDSGFLGHTGLVTLIQYWRSFEDLEKYARSRDQSHWPAWMKFVKRVGHTQGDVGIWHETYKIRAGEYETIYNGMPPFGLGKIGRLVPVGGGRESAKERISSASHDG